MLSMVLCVRIGSDGVGEVGELELEEESSDVRLEQVGLGEVRVEVDEVRL